MTEKQRIQEQTFFETAQKWLNENGTLKVNYMEDSLQYKVTFSNEIEQTELVGDDTLKLTIQIYNEVKN